MINSVIANEILDGIVGLKTTNSGEGQNITFNGDIYLGLLTKFPNGNGAAYEDGTYFSEPIDDNYDRIQLNTKSRQTKRDFILGAFNGEEIEIDGDKAIPACVTNDSAIIFAESSTDWGEVVGFGLFRNDEKTDNTLPFLWGPIINSNGDEGITVRRHEVPVIRAGSFKISLI